MFHVRSIYPGQERVEEGTFQLEPTHPQGEAVCKLFAEFLRGRPSEFRDKLSFLKKGDFEIDWSAGPGGVALVSILRHNEPAWMAVLVTGLDQHTDGMMLEVFEENVLSPLFGDCYHDAVIVSERPLLLQVNFAEPEWVPAMQLLGTALASVYFRSMLQQVDQRCGA